MCAMPLITLQQVTFDHGGPLILNQADFSIEEGERLALVGRNGVGKSTLLALLSGEVLPGEGIISRRQKLRVRKLNQLPLRGGEKSIGDLIKSAVAVAGHTGWQAESRFGEIVAKLDLDTEQMLATLSAGMLRRAELAAAIAAEPDLLLLDEPTNHLDIESVRAVEEILHEMKTAVLYVTHDRRFVEKTATGIVELDRGKLYRYPGQWDVFLERRAAAWENEAKVRAEFDKTLAEEEAWIRRGVKARRARNMGRVRALVKMREEHRERRERIGKAEIKIQSAEKSGQLVLKTEKLTFGFGDRAIVKDLDLEVMRGDRLGIVGRNGCGKSTLVKLLLGELAATSGTIRLGTNLDIAFFDQHQEVLDSNLSVRDAVADGNQTVEVDGKSRHVVSYLEDFLFAPDQSRGPVAKLSGGERNRLCLARLFARKINLLVLDEPTNDLDIETLELLENVVAEFPGTLIVISHDRAFLDNVVTSILAYEGDGKWKEYDGGFADYERVKTAETAASVSASAAKAAAATASAKSADAPKDKKRRLGNKERKELEELPAKIEALEREQSELHEKMADPAFFKKDGGAIAAAKSRIAAVEKEITAAYARWEEISSLE